MKTKTKKKRNKKVSKTKRGQNKVNEKGKWENK